MLRDSLITTPDAKYYKNTTLSDRKTERRILYFMDKKTISQLQPVYIHWQYAIVAVNYVRIRLTFDKDIVIKCKGYENTIR